MKHIDLFFYTAYLFLRKLGRNEDNAKWSAMLHASFFSVIMLIIIIQIGCLISKFTDFKYLTKNLVFIFAVGLFALCFFYFRYYRTNKSNEMETYFLSLPETNQKKIEREYLLVNITTIVLFFTLLFVNR